ncbi:FOXM1 protein, partial [Bucco capensis]|nr:FOXM1 protein [Bucco capensis]
MRSSPRRPLILKRRKLNIPPRDDASSSSARNESSAKQQQSQEDQPNSQPKMKTDCGLQKFPAGIKIIDHPTMPNTQVVAIPANADLQSIIEALTARGKECGSNGPNKFILICIGGMSHSAGPTPSERKPSAVSKAADGQGREKDVTKTPDLAGRARLWHSGTASMAGHEEESNSSGETLSSLLDNSVTSTQWLRKMSCDGLSLCSVKQDTQKENQMPWQQRVKTEEDPPAAASSFSFWRGSVSKRPPYSYMAMIQFAINSTEKKRMTLKDIYSWIEDNFPYFKYVAKPGWKNSIRHNLSLHDVFVRETSPNGKVSFWTVHPDTNRSLGLDQVFEPQDMEPPASSEHSEPQHSSHLPGAQKNMESNSSSSKAEPQNPRRKMKPLLPRISSYLVPIQFPVSQALVLQPPLKIHLSIAQGAALSTSEAFQSDTPKMPLFTEESSSLPMATIKEESPWEEGFFSQPTSLQESSSQPAEQSASFPDSICIKKEEDSELDEWLSPLGSTVQVKEEPDLLLPACSCKEEEQEFPLLPSPAKAVADTLVIKRRDTWQLGRSRRKQRLARPHAEEPLLVLPASNSCDPACSGAQQHFLKEEKPLENASLLSCSQGEEGPFKTPVKDMFSKLPVSSTPSKVSVATTPPLEISKVVSLAKGNQELDFSPVRALQLPFTPLQESQDLLALNSTPLRSPLFESPRELLNTEPSDLLPAPLTSSPAFPQESAKQASVEVQASGFVENRSLMEGLILDTMNDSLSKILLDVSFPGLEEENLGTDISWSQLIPEPK